MDVWDDLDPSGEARVAWVRPVAPPEAVLLLGAFDPPTLAHVAILRAAATHLRAPGAFCMTKVLLDRPADPLLPPAERLALLERVAADEGFGLAVANRGTYVEVADAANAAGIRPTFVIGADKLPQLENPAFYEDGQAGVERTFRTVRFLVVPRGPGSTPAGVETLPDAFERSEIGPISASQVRARVRRGDDVTDLVPFPVAVTLRRYTERAERL